LRSAGRVGRKFQSLAWNADWEDVLTELRGMDDGLPNRLDRTDACRNAQVPAVVRMAWEALA
jgi:hypothetical protein